jgi:hypothetical protein
VWTLELVCSGLPLHMINANLACSMLSCRRHELDSLRSTEAKRAEDFGAMLQGFAQQAVRGVEAEGPALRRRLAHLVGALRLTRYFLAGVCRGCIVDCLLLLMMDTRTPASLAEGYVPLGAVVIGRHPGATPRHFPHARRPSAHRGGRAVRVQPAWQEGRQAAVPPDACQCRGSR